MPAVATAQSRPLPLSDSQKRAVETGYLQPAAFTTAVRSSAVRPKALNAALAALARYRDQVAKPRYLTVIDMAAHSSKRRMLVIDLKTGKSKAYLVAHGRGSDPDYDGYADRFSNRPNSKMSSLGAYVTRGTYYGKHGLSLRLAGLESSNDNAMERAIVMHGASYVAPGRAVLGRSWGCPAIEQRYAKRLIPLLANGSFLYITR